MRIVILGSGFGGVYTAQWLLSRGPFTRRPKIVFICRRPHFEFKPLFIEVLGGRLAPQSTRLSLSGIFGDAVQKIKIATVTGIEPEKRIVETNKGAVPFDYLVIALGGTTQLIPMTRGASVFSLESLDECINLRDRISRLKDSPLQKSDRRNTVVILGAGSTGVEAATEISYLLGGVQGGRKTGKSLSQSGICLVESRDRILPNWSKAFRLRAESALRESRIDVLTGVGVSRIGKGRIYVGGRKSIAAGTIIYCGGLRGLPVYESLGVPLDEKGRLRVNSCLRLPRHENIYAMGDAISAEDFATPFPQNAQAAYQQAKIIAANILRDECGKPPRRFTYSELGEAIPLGGRRATAQILGVPVEGSLAWTLEKAAFMARIPGWRNKMRLFNDLALNPLVERGEEYLEKRR